MKFVLIYSANGRVTGLTKVKQLEPGQIDIGKDYYVLLMNNPDRLPLLYVDSSQVPPKVIEKKISSRSTNPMVVLPYTKPELPADVVIHLSSTTGTFVADKTFDQGVIVLGVKKTDHQSRPFRISMNKSNCVFKYSRRINPLDYDWFVNHPLLEASYSVTLSLE